MGVNAYRPRFSDAADTRQLGLMVDRYLAREEAATPSADYVLARRAYSRQTCRAGSLVQPLNNQEIRLADSALEYPACGVVLTVLGDSQVKWAPAAWLELKIGGAVQAGFRRLWLGRNGHPTFTPPDGGLRQAVGVATSYNTTAGTYFCLIQPSAEIEHAGCIWEYSPETYIAVDTINQRINFYIDGALVARLDENGYWRLRGEVIEAPYTSERTLSGCILCGCSGGGTSLIMFDPTEREILFGVYKTGDDGQVVQVAALDANGDFRIYLVMEDPPTYPVAASPARLCYAQWTPADSMLDFTWDLSNIYMRLERTTVAGTTNAILHIDTVMEHAL